MPNSADDDFRGKVKKVTVAGKLIGLSLEGAYEIKGRIFKKNTKETKIPLYGNYN